MIIELFFSYDSIPEYSYKSDVVPQVGDIITVVDVEDGLIPYEVRRVMHWITMASDGTFSLKSVKLLVAGSFYLLQNAKHTGTDNKYLVTIGEGEE